MPGADDLCESESKPPSALDRDAGEQAADPEDPAEYKARQKEVMERRAVEERRWNIQRGTVRMQHQHRSADERRETERDEQDVQHCAHDQAFFRAAMEVAAVTKPTTLTLLNGIRIAAISGVRWPLTANDTPTTL